MWGVLSCLNGQISYLYMLYLNPWSISFLKCQSYDVSLVISNPADSKNDIDQEYPWDTVAVPVIVAEPCILTEVLGYFPDKGTTLVLSLVKYQGPSEFSLQPWSTY